MGFTLIELIVALVVLSIASALLLTFVTPVASSVDPMLRAQSRSLATAYLDEILLRDYGAGPGDCNGGNRATYDTVWCYNGLSEAPRDQFGSAIPSLSDYQVTVEVSDTGAAAEISVDVSHPETGTATLEAYRGNY